MKAKWSWGLVAVAALAWWMAGCETPPKPSEFTAELEQERAQAVPQIGGVSEERAYKADVATVSAAAQAVMKDAGVTVVRTSETAEGNWYLGRSLAGRQVVIEVRPVLPGTTMVRTTVQGDDAVARGLLEYLMNHINGKIEKS
jgi:hypothetical protein